jgi:signal peptidase I
MNDSRDPYNTPPEPERFDPPTPSDDRTPVAPVSHEPHVAYEYGPTDDRPDQRQVVDGEIVEPAIPREDGMALAGPIEERLTRPGHALEPLPAMVGDFATTHAEAVSGPSLTSRLVDEFVAWLKTLASAAVYATLIVTFGFQVARVEGQSMAPTLQNQDRLIVNKLAYRLGDPQVGDIVMLYYPADPEKSFVKRVIAEAGDTVKIVDGRVYRNDVLLDDSFVPPEYRSHEDFGPKVIEPGYYFVMGDHRNNSSDSRHWGQVPKKYIIGRVQLRWWPVPEARTF